MAIFNKKANSKTTLVTNAKVCEEMRDYSKDDFFVKKAEKARDFLKKWGVPKELIVQK